MAGTYVPTTHVAPETATVGGVSIDGLSPGRTYVVLNDQWVPSAIFLPTSLTSDGYPTGMQPFNTGTGKVA
jgi:hypothetical protein